VGPFQSSKLWLQDLVGLSKDALHIYVGLAVFLLALALLRAPLRDWRPVAAVFAVALAGEVWDLSNGPRGADPCSGPITGTICGTRAFWPLVLFALARWTEVLKREDPQRLGEVRPTSGSADRRLSS
jgi:hypothetical protein